MVGAGLVCSVYGVLLGYSSLLTGAEAGKIPRDEFVHEPSQRDWNLSFDLLALYPLLSSYYQCASEQDTVLRQTKLYSDGPSLTPNPNPHPIPLQSQCLFRAQTI